MNQATARRQPSSAERKAQRNRLYAKIHAIWGNLRRDLTKGSADYKEALYTFAESELKLERIGSFTELTIPQLIRVVEALEREQAQPPLYTPAANVVQFKPKPAPSASETIHGGSPVPVEHFASTEQRFAINRLFVYLGWSEAFQGKFIRQRYRTDKAERLTKKEAHALIRILLNCAGQKYWKGQGKETVSKPMIKAAIPHVKKAIGIN